MGVLKSGFLFLVFAVSLYPVFVLLLTNPWLQRQCVSLLPLLFLFFRRLFCVLSVMNNPLCFRDEINFEFDDSLTRVYRIAHYMLIRSILASGMMSTSQSLLALLLIR